MIRSRLVLMSAVILCHMLVSSIRLNAQARLIVNGAKINLNQGAYLVIDNAANNAITRNSGHILSEGEKNVIKWNLGNASGLINIPWGIGSNVYIPMSFTKTGGSGNGYFLFSTYATPAQNSLSLPGVVTNFTGASGVDKSLLAIDRFWQINAQDYTTKPSLTSLKFTYADAELLTPNNPSIESKLTTQRWNEVNQTWNDFAPAASVNTTENVVTLATLNSEDLHAWWTLDYVEDRHWVSASSNQWSNPLNWSTTIDGPGGASVPASLDAVFLNPDIDTNLSLDTDISVARLTMADGYSGVLNQGNHAVTITSEAKFAGGTFNGGDGPITVTGPFTVTGTAFNSTSGILELKSNFNFSGGQFLHHGGTVKFSGVDTQIISGSSRTDFNNITVSNTGGVTMESDQNLAGILELLPNTWVDTDGTSDQTIFTLRSTNDSPVADASIAPLPAGARVRGKVTIQRYMAIEGASSGRIYRYISSPLQNASVADLQNEIPITGSFTGTSSCSGCGVNQSMFEYDETVTSDINKSGSNDSNDGYVDFPAASNTELLTPGKGYALYVRGNTLTTARWDVRGTINAGNEIPITLPVTFTSSGNITQDGWNLVGNPFPSTIDWNAPTGWTKENMDGAIYIRNNGSIPSQFASWNGVVGTNGGSRYIALGQAFWVKSNGQGNPVLRASETIKSSSTPSVFFREIPPSNLLRLTLIKGTVRDESVIHFREDATENFDTQADALKLPSESFNLSTLLSDNTRMSINSLANLECETTVRIGMENTTAGMYSLDFSAFESFDENVTLTLVDNFKKSSVNIRLVPSYTFTVTTDPQSYGLSRFTITFHVSNPALDFTMQSSPVCEDADAQVQLTSLGALTYAVSVNEKLISTIQGDGQVALNIEAKYLVAEENKISVMATHCGGTLVKELLVPVGKRPTLDVVTDGYVCEGGTVTLHASGAGNGVYNWYESDTLGTALSEHTSFFTTPVLHESKLYYVSATSALGCESARVGVLAHVIILDTVKISTEGKTLVSNYDSGNQWYFNNQLIEGANDRYLDANQPGTYSLEVTNMGCRAAANFELSVTGTSPEEEFNLTAFPNPVVDEVTIMLPVQYAHATVGVLNSGGVQVGSIPLTFSNGKLTGKFNMAHLAPGLYILSGQTTNKVFNIKVLKQ